LIFDIASWAVMLQVASNGDYLETALYVAQPEIFLRIALTVL